MCVLPPGLPRPTAGDPQRSASPSAFPCTWRSQKSVLRGLGGLGVGTVTRVSLPPPQPDVLGTGGAGPSTSLPSLPGPQRSWGHGTVSPRSRRGQLPEEIGEFRLML